MEVLVVLVVALLVLGPQKLPEAGRQLGKALAELRRWSSDLQGELHDALQPDREVQPHAAAQPEAQAPAPDAPQPPPIGNGQAPDLHPSPSPDGGEVW
jgi:Tat protein translocase TatB subunit